MAGRREGREVRVGRTLVAEEVEWVGRREEAFWGKGMDEVERDGECRGEFAPRDPEEEDPLLLATSSL